MLRAHLFPLNCSLQNRQDLQNVSSSRSFCWVSNTCSCNIDNYYITLDLLKTVPSLKVLTKYLANLTIYLSPLESISAPKVYQDIKEKGK